MLAKTAIYLISAYKYCLSPLLGNNCRFYPSCSSYTQEALRRHGLLKGSVLGVKRICSCHPWHHGGCDPVPDQFSLINKKV